MAPRSRHKIIIACDTFVSARDASLVHNRFRRVDVDTISSGCSTSAACCRASCCPCAKSRGEGVLLLTARWLMHAHVMVSKVVLVAACCTAACTAKVAHHHFVQAEVAAARWARLWNHLSVSPNGFSRDPCPHDRRTHRRAGYVPVW